MIEKVKTFRRALADYYKSPLFADRGPDGRELSPALTKAMSETVIAATLQLATAARDLAGAAGDEFDVSPLTRFAADLIRAAGAIAADADRAERHVYVSTEHLADGRAAVALVAAIKARTVKRAAGKSAPAPAEDEWMIQTEAAERAEISVERLRPWVTRKKNPLPSKWVGARQFVRLADVLRERDLQNEQNERRAKAKSPARPARKGTEGHAARRARGGSEAR